MLCFAGKFLDENPDTGSEALVVTIDTTRYRVEMLPIYPLRDRPCAHSFDFSWGYHGSGPAELSRSILIYFFKPGITTVEEQINLHPALYQEFKKDFVSKFSVKNGWVVTEQEIREWLNTETIRSLPWWINPK